MAPDPGCLAPDPAGEARPRGGDVEEEIFASLDRQVGGAARFAQRAMKGTTAAAASWSTGSQSGSRPSYSGTEYAALRPFLSPHS